MNFREQRYKLLLARNGLMLDDQAQILANDHAVVRAHAANNIPGYQTPEEQMIHIGDQHTHAHTTPAKPGLSPLAAGLIGAGLLATGLGIPAAGYFIAEAIRQPPVPVPSTVVTPGDGNTKYQLRLLP